MAAININNLDYKALECSINKLRIIEWFGNQISEEEIEQVRENDAKG